MLYKIANNYGFSSTSRAAKKDLSIAEFCKRHYTSGIMYGAFIKKNVIITYDKNKMGSYI